MAIQFDTDELEVSTSTVEAPEASGLRSLTARKRAGASERMFFTEQLALLLETGESLSSAEGLHDGLNRRVPLRFEACHEGHDEFSLSNLQEGPPQFRTTHKAALCLVNSL